MKKNPNFEQKYLSRTAEGIYKTGHDRIRLMKWMAFYQRYFQNRSFSDLIASILTCLKDLFQ